MTFIATEKVAVMRGTSTDALGNEIDSEEVVDGLDAVFVSIIEKSRRVYLPESSELRTVRYGVGRATPGTDIRQGDRLRSARTGRTWIVNEVSGGERTIAGFRALVFDLRTGDNPSTVA